MKNEKEKTHEKNVIKFLITDYLFILRKEKPNSNKLHSFNSSVFFFIPLQMFDFFFLSFEFFFYFSFSKCSFENYEKET